ncbi:hypothetical protein QBB31_44285, partial [Streptomyces scabiei]
VVEDGMPLAALTTEEVRAEVAGEVQRYARGRCCSGGRGCVPTTWRSPWCRRASGSPPWSVLAADPVVRPGTGLGGHIWRGRQVTGNNRGDARLQVFELVAQQLLMGVPQYLLRLDGEEENRRLVLLGLGEILRRISALLNTEYADPDRHPEGRAERALRSAQVPARVVVGASIPERLEESLRQLNVHRTICAAS